MIPTLPKSLNQMALHGYVVLEHKSIAVQNETSVKLKIAKGRKKKHAKNNEAKAK